MSGLIKAAFPPVMRHEAVGAVVGVVGRELPPTAVCLACVVVVVACRHEVWNAGGVEDRHRLARRIPEGRLAAIVHHVAHVERQLNVSGSGVVRDPSR